MTDTSFTFKIETSSPQNAGSPWTLWLNGGYKGELKIIKSNSKNTMNLKEQFALAFKKEPQKSYIKAGIMDSDENLTDDGKDIYLDYLMNNDTDFKKDVVDPILKEQSAEAAK